MGGSTGGSGSSTTTAGFLPTQKDTLKWLSPQMKAILSGDTNNPIAKTMQQTMYSAGMKELQNEKGQLAQSNLPTPAKTQLFKDLMTKGAEVGATAMASPYSKALEYLESLTLAAPRYSSSSSQSGGFSVKIV